MRSWPPMAGARQRDSGNRGLSAQGHRVRQRRQALSPWHTTKKNGRRYRYYLPQRDAKEHAGASGPAAICQPQNWNRRCSTNCARSCVRPNLLGDMLPQANQTRSDPGRSQDHRGHDPARRDLGSTVPSEQTRIVKLLDGEGHRVAQRPRSAAARQWHRTVGAGTASRACQPNSGGIGMSDIRIQKPASRTSCRPATAG